MQEGYTSWPDEDRLAWYKSREDVTYTDGTQVQDGDKARYHQAPGGLLPHGDWKYGVIVAMPAPHPGATEYVLKDDENGRLYNLYSHVIERT